MFTELKKSRFFPFSKWTPHFTGHLGNQWTALFAQARATCQCTFYEIGLRRWHIRLHCLYPFRSQSYLWSLQWFLYLCLLVKHFPLKTNYFFFFLFWVFTDPNCSKLLQWQLVNTRAVIQSLGRWHRSCRVMSFSVPDALWERSYVFVSIRDQPF